VTDLLATTAELYRSDPEVMAAVAELHRRLDEPLRVALVGSVKAGKSTLLNALLGEHLAPTDARECTKIVTWYHHGATPSVQAEHKTDGVVRLPLLRQDSRLELDLGHLDADSVERLDVAWPAVALSDLTLIDTPGTVSISTALSARTQEFISPGGDVSGADAIVYLLRSLHASDIEFLRSLPEQTSGESSMGAIAVLSRADELGAGRLNAMTTVAKAVDKLREDPTLSGVCETIVPVAGLLALAGETLRQSEFMNLLALEQLSPEVLKHLLVSVDRFLTDEGPGIPPPQVRADLMNRFGLFGVRLAVAMIRGGARDAPALAQQLVLHSGLEDLRRVIDVHFRRRHPQLKAGALMRALQQLIRDHPRPGSEVIEAATDEYLADQHPWQEMRLLGRVRSSRLDIDADEQVGLERLLGGSGTSPAERLGAPTATDQTLRDLALAQYWKWHDLAANPLTDPDTSDACRVAARSCEGILAEIDAYA
jgi:hypothetical protein